MSVLSFPRLYFSGAMSWDPIVANNVRAIYDAVTARAGLLPGETAAAFRQRLINNTVARGDWNYFGSHICALEKTQITGGAPEPRESASPDDQLLEAPVELIGKLVDIDPAGALSQVFFDEFSIGVPGRAHLRARPRRRMSSRWINFGRNLGPRDPAAPAAGASAAWQAVFPAADVEIVRAAESPLLESLEEALRHPRARGLMCRMSTYWTQYYQNGIRNPFPSVRAIEELQQLHQQELFPNPAYSVVVGAVGVWFEGDSETVPGGRLLFRSEPDGLLGPAAAEFHPTDGILSLDFSNTIPEQDANLEKVDLGPIVVSVAQGGVSTEIGRIEPTDYHRAAYEATAGIVDVDVSAPPDGVLSLRVDTAGGSSLLTERELSAFCDDCNVYLDQDEVRTLTIQARERGAAPTRPLSVLVATYPRTMNQPTEPTVLPVSADGTAKLEIRGTSPGFRHLGFVVVPAGQIAQPPESLDIDSAQLTSVRTLPFDDALEAATSDDELTWEFIYANVLLTYDAIAPRMSTIIDLSDADAVRTFARRLKEVTAAELFESLRYMPVTRDLSRGRRTLLHRFCDLALSGQSEVEPAAVAHVVQGLDALRQAASPPTSDRLPGVPAGRFFDKRVVE
ncbi:MAG: hypothetical protein ACRDTG_02280 [Pseudonocardiaceae bacterium]